MKTRSIFDSFNELSSINLTFPGNNYGTADIYGNGRNQVEVYVTVKIVDINYKPLPITEQDIQRLVYLCDYTTGSKLTLPWEVSDTPGDFVNSITSQSSKGNSETDIFASDYVTVSKFVSCNELKDGLKIAAGIDIPGVGAFDTSEHGTDTLNGPEGESGSIYKNSQFLTISAKTPKYYSKQNITMDVKNWEEMSKTLKCLYSTREFLTGFFQKFTSENHGELYQRIIYLKLENGYPIKKIEHDGQQLTNEMMSSSFELWNAFPMNQRTFSAIQSPSPFSIVWKHVDRNTLETYMWYLPHVKENISIDGLIFVQDRSGDDKLCSIEAKRNYTNDIEVLNAIPLYVYKIKNGKDHYDAPHHWSDHDAIIKVTFFDVYGNKGNFSLEVNGEDYFEEALLRE